MTLKDIRKAYDKNYHQMLEIIEQMGGDHMIGEHRREKSALYRKLRSLQKIEHRLSEMETRLTESREDVLNEAEVASTSQANV